MNFYLLLTATKEKNQLIQNNIHILLIRQSEQNIDIVLILLNQLQNFVCLSLHYN